MLDAALMSMSALVADTLATGRAPKALGNAHPAYAGYATYDTRDGLLMVGAFTKSQMAQLYQALGDEARALTVRTWPRERMKERLEEDSQFLRQIFATGSSDHWERILNKAGVPAAGVRTLSETLAKRQLDGRAVLQSYAGADHGQMPERLPVAAYTYQHDGPQITAGPPTVGQHTEAILRELGYDASAIEALARKRIIAGQSS